MDIAKLARHNLHIKWRNFLTDAVQRWQKHTEDFQREESELTQQIEAAKTSLAAAVRRFEGSKSELGVQVIDVEAHAAMAEASTDAADGGAAGAALIDSLTTMRSQLETVQASAEAMVTGRGQQFQQKTASRRGIRAACAIFCAISHATSHATICATGVPGESKSAFSTARQEVTEVYPCLGHSSVLNWTHSACDESWFTTRWFAIESAYELAWKLGTPQTLVSDHHERKPSACGKRRQVCFFF